MRARTEVAYEYALLDLSKASVTIEGFGAVGKPVVKFLTEKDANVVAGSDSKGAIYQPDGLDYETLRKVKETAGAVKNYTRGRRIENEELFRLPVDILIPGARPDVVSNKNVRHIRATLVVEAANIPATMEAERILHDRGILVVPDFIANAGGLITGAVEYRGGTEKEVFEVIEER